MAQASRVYRPYDAALADTYLEAARRAYAFLKANGFDQARRDDVRDWQLRRQQRDSDNRLWAAAELWETTGEAEFLTDFEAVAGVDARWRSNFDWDNVANLGMFTYLLSTRDGPRPGDGRCC